MGILRLCANSIRNGCSVRQEGHQVAQTFNRLTLPLKTSWVSVWPGRSSQGNSNDGTGLSINAEGNACGSRDRPRNRKTPRITATDNGKNTINRLILST